MHQSPRILITRPQPDADDLANTLHTLGIDTLIAPMLHVSYNQSVIHALEKALTQKLYTAIIFTSSNAVRSVASFTALHRILCLCVGEKTAKTARSAGFHHISHSNGDMQALSDYITREHSPKDGTLLYISATQTSGDLAGTLTKQGYTVEQFQTYSTLATTELNQGTLTALDNHQLDAALFYSPRTARLFCELINASQRQEALSHMEAICLSESIKNAISDLPWKSIHHALSPHNDAMLNIIRKLGFINNSSAL